MAGEVKTKVRRIEEHKNRLADAMTTLNKAADYIDHKFAPIIKCTPAATPSNRAQELKAAGGDCEYESMIIDLERKILMMAERLIDTAERSAV